ncbi:MAG: hypothetical protein ACLSDQ_00305 [Adlercreutzia equolifaciens]
MAPRIHERTRDRISAVQVLYTSELTGNRPASCSTAAVPGGARGSRR